MEPKNGRKSPCPRFVVSWFCCFVPSLLRSPPPRRRPALSRIFPFPGGLALTALAQAPSDPGRLYAISRESFLLRSDDGGRSFAAASLTPIAADNLRIETDPEDADRLYLVKTFLERGAAQHRRRPDPGPPRAAARRQRLLARSAAARGSISRLAIRRLLRHEEGSGWTELPEIAPGNVDARLADLAIDPERPGHLLAGLDLGFIDPLSGIHESVDGGQTWIGRLSGSSPVQLAFDSFEPSVAWAILHSGDDALWRSADGGGGWADQHLAQGGFSLRFQLDPRVPATWR